MGSVWGSGELSERQRLCRKQAWPPRLLGEPQAGALQQPGHLCGDHVAPGRRHADLPTRGQLHGREVRPIPPLVTAEQVAVGILACARKSKREVTFGRAGQLAEAFHQISPGLYNRVLPPFFDRATFASQRRPHSRETCSNRPNPSPASRAAGSSDADFRVSSRPASRCLRYRSPPGAVGSGTKCIVLARSVGGAPSGTAAQDGTRRGDSPTSEAQPAPRHLSLP